MISSEKREELQNIIHGKSIEGRQDNLTTTRNFLPASFATNTKAQRDFASQSVIKEAQKKRLISFASRAELWFNGVLYDKNYLTEGGEAKIHFSTKRNTVLKLNDAVYYHTWLDFLNSLLIHNLFFADTPYTLLGYSLLNDTLYAVLEQPFVMANESTDLDNARLFLETNGFQNFRRNDYRNNEFGLILEDVHDENVLSQNGNLFFIDTVFYLDL